MQIEKKGVLLTKMEVLSRKENLYDEFIPMYEILDKKNIDGVYVTIRDNKVFISFDKDYLGEVNKFILFKISNVYCETLYYSNNKENPVLDKVEFWAPGDFYDINVVTKNCLDKKYMVLELPLEDVLKVVGTSIMIANCLQEQDVFDIKINEGKKVFSEDEIIRHDRYIKNGCPDKEWLHLTISLDKDNPLNSNPYASFLSMAAINTPLQDTNMITETIVGYEVKRYISFCMDSRYLLENIKRYLESDYSSVDVMSVIDMNGEYKKLLGKN